MGCGGGREPVGESESSVFEDFPVGWTELPAPPEVRNRAAMAWTGDKLLVWGGYEFTGYGDEVEQSDGFAFAAPRLTWEAIAVPPLAQRAFPASAWTGEELLVWGGSDRRRERFFDDGAAYDPDTDTWRTLPKHPLSARAPLSVWTGDEFIVWGTALRMYPRRRDGAAYAPATNSWRTISVAPVELTDATAVWTGREMIVFGAALHGGNFPETKSAIGAAYDPATDRWRKLPDSDLSPQASTAAWAGPEVVAWDYLNGSAAYDPVEDRWRALADVPLNSGECSPESVSVASRVVGNYCGLLAVYDAATDRWDALGGVEIAGWNNELVRAGPVVLLLGRNADSGRRRLLAYRPG